MKPFIPRLQTSMLLLFCLLPLSVTSTAQDAHGIHQELLAEIRNEREQLASAEQHIQQQRQSMVTRLKNLETEVTELRRQTATARRAEDEITLSLSRLQNRLDQWREQSQFQHYLLNSYYALVNRQAPEQSASRFTRLSLGEKLRWLHSDVNRILQGMQPQWQKQTIVLADGTLANTSTLSIGPVNWFLDSGGHQGGLLNTSTKPGEDVAGTVAYTFDPAHQAELEQLHSSGQGKVTFDPTLGRALALPGQHDNLQDHIARGGIWVLPIMLFALLATGIALVKAVQYWRLPKLLGTQGKDGKNLMEYMGDRQGRLVGVEAALASITRDTPPGQARDDRLFGLLMKTRTQLEKWLGAIAVIAAISPLLGLLGTVSGMIETFELMTLFGAGDPEAVSSGISKALITTELGLIVAIPALIAHAILSRLIRNYLGALENTALELSQWPDQTLQTQGGPA